MSPRPPPTSTTAGRRRSVASPCLATAEQLQSELEDTDAALAQAVVDLQAIEALASRRPSSTRPQAEVEREAELLAQRLEDALGQAAISEIERGATEAQRQSKTSPRWRASSCARSRASASSRVRESTEGLISEPVSSAPLSSQSRSLQILEAKSVSRNREARLQAVRETVTDLKQQADENLVAAEAARTAAADRKAEVEQLIVDQQAKKATIEERKSAAEAKVAENEAAQQSLQSEIKGIHRGAGRT